MHDVVVNELEDYLAGSGNAGACSTAFQSHLAACGECRAELESITGLAGLFAELRSDPETAPSPSPFFYTRVAATIVEHQRTDHWGLFAPGAAFFRRIAFASLLVMAALGSYLVTREDSFAGTDPTTIMAQHDVTADHAVASDRDMMLATLATYGE